MKISIITCLMSALGILVISNAYCSSTWDEFFLQPDKNAVLVLENAIVMSKEHCSQDISPSQKHRTQLFALISGGNPWAFRAALLVSKCWDGGELEDFYRSSGTFFEQQPLFFLQLVKDKEISELQLKLLLTMLPLDTVDNIDRKISVVEGRIVILKCFSDEAFNEISKRGLYFLEKEKENLSRIKIEIDGESK